MESLRRRLASFALALAVLQAALLFAAPLSACCRPDGARTRTPAVRAAERAMDSEDCCPPGSHPPGQCPRHRSARTAARSTECRMTCDAAPSSFFIGTIGVLAAPAVIHVPFSSAAVHATSSAPLTVRPAFPDAPPPKLL
jgi:hypothetical protein